MFQGYSNGYSFKWFCWSNTSFKCLRHEKIDLRMVTTLFVQMWTKYLLCGDSTHHHLYTKKNKTNIYSNGSVSIILSANWIERKSERDWSSPSIHRCSQSIVQIGYETQTPTIIIIIIIIIVAMFNVKVHILVNS